MASAELLTTANPIGQGKWAVMGAGIQDSNLSDMGSSVTLTTYGAYIGYGITDALDVFLQAGTSASTTFDVQNPAPPPTTLDCDVTGTGWGLNLKYAVLSEKTMPVSDRIE